MSPIIFPGALTGLTPARLCFWVAGVNIPHRILKTSLAEEVGSDSADGAAGEEAAEQGCKIIAV